MNYSYIRAVIHWLEEGVRRHIGPEDAKEMAKRLREDIDYVLDDQGNCYYPKTHAPGCECGDLNAQDTDEED